MKTLAYEVCFRLENTIHEQIINNGILIAYIDEKNHFKFLEGLLTNDYMYGKFEGEKCIFTLYSSYVLQELYSGLDIKNLTEKLINEMEVYWEGVIGIDELEFPFDINFEVEYPNNYEEDKKEYIKERVNISCGKLICDVEKCKSLIKDFKRDKVFIGL